MAAFVPIKSKQLPIMALQRSIVASLGFAFVEKAVAVDHGGQTDHEVHLASRVVIVAITVKAYLVICVTFSPAECGCFW